MEYTGFGKEKEKFVPRKSYEEFHRDGIIIEKLYEWTDELIADKFYVPYGEYTLQVFNYAYRICWMSFDGKDPSWLIYSMLSNENEIVQEYSLAVAYALFRLHQEFYPFPSSFRRQWVSRIPLSLRQRYANFMKGKTLPYPIDFCASILSIDYSDNMMDIYERASRLENENKKLRKLLEEEIAERKEAEQTISTLSEKLDAWENNDFYKAVNIDTIVNYVNEQRRNLTEHDVLVIQGMLNRLCRNKKISNEAFKEIDNLTCGGKLTIGTQYNNNCQQFNGTITDSEFPSK